MRHTQANHSVVKLSVSLRLYHIKPPVLAWVQGLQYGYGTDLERTLPFALGSSRGWRAR